MPRRENSSFRWPQALVRPNGFQDGRRAVAILNVGGVNDDADQQAQRVDDDVALAALDLLASVEATKYASGVGRLALSDANR